MIDTPSDRQIPADLRDAFDRACWLEQRWKRHDSDAVAARYRHAFGGLSVRFLVGQSVRNPADSIELSAHGRPALAHLFYMVELLV